MGGHRRLGIMMNGARSQSVRRTTRLLTSTWQQRNHGGGYAYLLLFEKLDGRSCCSFSSASSPPARHAQQQQQQQLWQQRHDTSTAREEMLLTRDFIAKSLYNRDSGYFSTKDVINHLPGALDFGSMLGEWHYRMAVRQVRRGIGCLC